MLLVAKFGREGVLSSDRVNRMLHHWGHPGVDLVWSGNPLKRMPLRPSLLELGKVLLESGTDLGQKLDEAMREVSRSRRLGIEDLLRGLIHIESPWRSGDVDALVLQSVDENVHEIAMHFPVTRGRVPGGSGEHLEASQLVVLLGIIGRVIGQVQWHQRRPIFGRRHDEIRRRAIDVIGSATVSVTGHVSRLPIAAKKLVLAGVVQESQAGAILPGVGIGTVHGF